MLTKVSISRPYTTDKRGLIFPLVVRCATEEDALQVSKLQDLVELIGNKAALEVATMILSNAQIASLVVPGPFFPVFMGSDSVIYSDWYVFVLVPYCVNIYHRQDANEAISRTVAPLKWNICDNLKDAFAFMIQHYAQINYLVTEECATAFGSSKIANFYPQLATKPVETLQDPPPYPHRSKTIVGELHPCRLFRT